VIFSSTLFAEEAPTVKVAEAQIQELYDLYIYPVSLESKKESEVYSEIVGVIKEIKVEIGQTVTSGEPLLKLQHTQPEYSYAPFSVKSPIDGTVAAISKKTGSRVQQGDLLIHVVNRKDLEMIFEVPESELNLLKKGTKGEIEFRVINGKVPIEIKGISPLVKPMSGTALGKLTMTEAELSEEVKSRIRSKLYPGMIGRAKFKLNFRQGIAIPKEAVTFEKQKHMVRTIVNNKVIKKEITIGKEIDLLVEVTTGLAPGDTVVVSRSKYLKENEEVKIDKGEPGHE